MKPTLIPVFWFDEVTIFQFKIIEFINLKNTTKFQGIKVERRSDERIVQSRLGCTGVSTVAGCFSHAWFNDRLIRSDSVHSLDA